jgi:prephenate dehydrogenase
MNSDDQPGFMRSTRIAIIGLGLIGGSLALALRGHCAELLGVDPDPQALAVARRRGICDRLAATPEELLPAADVIVLATPARAILRLIHALPDLHTGRALVLDVGSTKTAIVQALSSLPERFDALGGHPMGGKEKGGLENADASLFEGVSFAFTPLPHTSEQARVFAGELAGVIGAHPLWLDPATHDTWAAYTSHLAYLVSAGLALATPGQAAPLAGPGFRSTTRLAASDPGMMLDILITNRANVRTALAQYRKQIDRLDAALAAADESALRHLLEEAAGRRAQIIQPALPVEKQSQ